MTDYSRSNHFIYHENINALYINGRKSWKRFGAQLGLRAENTIMYGNQLGNLHVTGSSFKRSYTGVFPTGFISYKLDSVGNVLSASVSRRISRPNYYLLNPFVIFRDNYSYSLGNTMLSPQYQNQLQLKYQHKQNLGLSLQYGRFKDVIFQTTQAVNNIFFTSPNNVSQGYMVIIASNYSVSPLQWWTINTNIMLAHMELNGITYTEKLKLSANAGRLTLMNQFNFNKKWSAELSGYYASKDIQGQTIVRPRYRVYAGTQLKIWKDKAAIKITAEDIFHSWVQKDYAVNIKQAESFRYNESDTQRIGIAFTYRFGKETFARKGKHVDNAADSEKARVE